MTDKNDWQELGPPRRLPSDDIRPAEWQDSLAIRRLVGRIFKRRYQIAVVFLLVVIPAAIATYLMQPLYRSTGLVQVKPDSVEVLPYRDVADAVVGGSNYYMGTQDQILRGVGLRSRVAKRLQTDHKEPEIRAEASRLADRFEVKKIENSELFELSYLAPHPELAARVVNLYAEEYVKQNFEMRQATREQAEKELEKELKGLESRLQVSEKELMRYAQLNNILSLEQGQVDPVQERLRALNQDLATAEAQVVISRSSLETLQNTSPDELPQRLVSEQVGALESNLRELEKDLTTLRATFGENWPAVIEKRNEATLVREQLTRERTSTLARHVEQARLDLASAEARRQLSQQALDEHESLVNQFHNASIHYNILKREVETNRNLYDGLLERLRQTSVMAGFQFGNIQVVEPGRPTRIPYSPKVVWNIGIAALLGLALGVVLVILLDSWDDTISTLEDIEQLAAPSLGSVPVIRGVRPAFALLRGRRLRKLPPAGDSKMLPAPGPALAAAQDAAVPFAVNESIRGICASILLSRSDARPRVIVVTSPTPAEGKTTLVTHLGREFAEAGVSTLVVEADMRKRDLSKAFAIGTEDGLSLYLAGHVADSPKVHETAIPNLFVTASGPVPPNPAALLHSDRLTQFLKEAATKYQMVLVDAPPLSMADARILGIRADGVVLVVRAGQTRRHLVRRAWTILETSGANALGIVLNGEDSNRSTLTYYQYDQTA